jgi:hypothetical protein
MRGTHQPRRERPGRLCQTSPLLRSLSAQPAIAAGASTLASIQAYVWTMRCLGCLPVLRLQVPRLRKLAAAVAALAMSTTSEVVALPSPRPRRAASSAPMMRPKAGFHHHVAAFSNSIGLRRACIQAGSVEIPSARSSRSDLSYLGSDNSASHRTRQAQIVGKPWGTIGQTIKNETYPAPKFRVASLPAQPNSVDYRRACLAPR